MAGLFAGGFYINKFLAVNLQIFAGVTDVVNRRDGKCVGERAGRADHVHADVIVIQQARAAAGIVAVGAGVGIFCPVAGVTGRDGHHSVLGCKIIQNCLIDRHRIGIRVHIGRILRRAGIAGAERQVDAVGAQNDRVLNGCHIVRIIRTAVRAEHLHNQQLRFRCNTLRFDSIQRGNIGGFAAICLRDIFVCRRDTGNVRAVLRLRVVVVRHVSILIYIIVCKRKLAAIVEVVGAHTVLRNVQLAEDRRYLARVEQIEAFDVVRIAICLLLQGIVERTVVERLVIGVDAGIDHSDPRARAGITGRISHARADHFGGCGHIGLRRQLFRRTVGIIALLHHNRLNIGQRADCVNLIIFDIGRDDVRSQRQIPHHVQLFAAKYVSGDFTRHRILRSTHLLPVIGGRIVGGKAVR